MRNKGNALAKSFTLEVPFSPCLLNHSPRPLPRTGVDVQAHSLSIHTTYVAHFRFFLVWTLSWGSNYSHVNPLRSSAFQVETALLWTPKKRRAWEARPGEGERVGIASRRPKRGVSSRPKSSAGFEVTKILYVQGLS